MDAMFWMQLIVVVIAIGIGAKWGGLGLGAAGGLGLFVLVFFFGLKPGNPLCQFFSLWLPLFLALRFCKGLVAWITLSE